jgi:type VI secretion system lysozyme-like protein
MRESVEREIHTLLNTRCPLGESVVDYETRSVIDYGLVDLSHYFTGNPNDRKRVAMHVAKTIAVYEPRLTRVNVVVEGIRRETGRLDLRVDGGLRVGTTIEPVSFPVRIEGAETAAER